MASAGHHSALSRAAASANALSSARSAAASSAIGRERFKLLPSLFGLIAQLDHGILQLYDSIVCVAQSPALGDVMHNDRVVLPHQLVEVVDRIVLRTACRDCVQRLRQLSHRIARSRSSSVALSATLRHLGRILQLSDLGLARPNSPVGAITHGEEREEERGEERRREEKRREETGEWLCTTQTLNMSGCK